MAEMMTAREIQEMLQVDRSTVYRMAEDGRLPAIKVGKQWRFPVAQVQAWFQGQMGGSGTLPGAGAVSAVVEAGRVDDDLATLLPLDCVQLIQDSFARALGVMLVVTDMDGRPLTRASNACGLFEVVIKSEDALQRCMQSWHNLASMLTLEPRLQMSHLGLLCARSMIRVGSELKGMVVAGCIAPDKWPPGEEEVGEMAQAFDVSAEIIRDNVEKVYFLDGGEKARVLSFLPQIADIVAHIVEERRGLMGRLQAIAELTAY